MILILNIVETNKKTFIMIKGKVCKSPCLCQQSSAVRGKVTATKCGTKIHQEGPRTHFGEIFLKNRGSSFQTTGIRDLYCTRPIWFYLLVLGLDFIYLFFFSRLSSNIHSFRSSVFLFVPGPGRARV